MSSKDVLAWKLIEQEDIVKNEWIHFRRRTYELPDGNRVDSFYDYSASNYAVVVATDEEGKVLCVRQFRHGLGEVTNELPAGGIEYPWQSETGEKVHIPIQIAMEGAIRELREETGYVSEEWSHLLTVPSNATRADNYAYIFRAKNCRKVTELQLDDTEFLHVNRYTPEEIDQLIEKGQFQQVVHVMAWEYVKARENPVVK